MITSRETLIDYDIATAQSWFVMELNWLLKRYRAYHQWREFTFIVCMFQLLMLIF